MIEINSIQELEALISNPRTPLILIEFYTTWCAPCQIMATHINKIATKLITKGIFLIKTNIEELALSGNEIQEKLKLKAPIMVVPTIVLFKNGVEVGRITGVKTHPLFSDELFNQITSILGL